MSKKDKKDKDTEDLLNKLFRLVRRLEDRDVDRDFILALVFLGLADVDKDAVEDLIEEVED